MHTKHYFSVLALAGTLTTAVLTGCVDQDYSLEDIDTEMKFEVNDLALPLNIAPVKLSNLVDLDAEECIEIIDGEYALVKSGEFESSAIDIKGIHAEATKENLDETTIPLPMNIPGQSVSVPGYLHKFNYNYDDVDKYIVNIESGNVNLTLSLHVSTHYTSGAVLPVEFEKLVVELPKGFYGTFDGETISETSGNVVTLKNKSTDAQGKLDLDFHVTSFNMEKAGGKLNDVTRDFTLSTGMGIQSADIISKGVGTDEAEIKVNFTISDLDVISITGTIWYEVKDLVTQQDILFDNLPDVLTDPETNLSLYNPQVYLSLVNPMGTVAYATTGLKISQIRNNGVAPAPAELVKPIEIGQESGNQEFCLLPHPDALDKPYYKYPDAEKYEMINLGKLISGEGLPQGLKVDFIDPILPEQRVIDFTLERHGVISGNYTLFAPLQLGANSKIYYKDTVTGWGLESDSDEMEIKHLSLEADITSHLPVDVIFTAKPINSEGEEIKGITISKAEIPAGKTTHVVITMDGEIFNLDGMSYIAVFKSETDSKVLHPDSSLDINNLKVRVTGNYIVKDEDDDEYDY